MKVKQTVAIFCGGSTYEHEVSIITGIQVAEAIDRTRYEPVFVYFDKDNNTFLLKNFKNKRDFNKKNRTEVRLIKGKDGLLLMAKNAFSKKVRKIDVVYLAFHGGVGESGPVQGFLELCGVPFTGPGVEGSVTSMNKALTKEVLQANNIPVLPWVKVTSENIQQSLKKVLDTLSLPVIIKPAHLGSSIGISIASTEVELEQQLKLALQLDREILVEPALKDFTEYNVSIRSNETGLQCSLIEEPVKTAQTLSFEDKYENGAKKTGGAGMESLERVLPAKIEKSLEESILSTAKQVYKAVRLAGLVRIDFLFANGRLYCSEVNPIPGSMSFYLWEAAGEQFESQITQSIENAVSQAQKNIHIHPYETDIVEKFIEN